MLDRLRELRQERPEINTLWHMMGQEKFLEWGHSIGVITDEKLRSMVPPLPPFHLRSIAGGWSESQFLWSGIREARQYYEIFRRHWTGEGTAAGLDFGVGSGRIIRFMSTVPGLRMHGSDANENLADWCKASLPAVQIERNRMAPPLPFESKAFDFVYGKSVFSHLPEDSAQAWLSELARASSPDAIVILTFNGQPMLRAIASSPESQRIWLISKEESEDISRRLDTDKFIYISGHERLKSRANLDGEYGHTFIAHSYIHDVWQSAGFQIVEIINGSPGQQDIAVLRRSG